MTSAGRFQGSLLRTAGSVLLVLRGELDLATSTSADALVDRALAEPTATYVLDMADLTFLDARGVGPLVRLANEASARGAAVVARHLCRSAEVVLSFTAIVAEDRLAQRCSGSGEVEARR